MVWGEVFAPAPASITENTWEIVPTRYKLMIDEGLCVVKWPGFDILPSMPPTLDLYQVDAFTDRAFAGNPAAVCFLDGPRDAGWMQAVAREMSLSETAFLIPAEDGLNLRWF